MGTNFYLTNREVATGRLTAGRHLGKRWACGGGQTAFTYAMEPEAIRAILTHDPQAKVVVDEYDRLLTGEQMTNVLDACARHDTDQIGTEFS